MGWFNHQLVLQLFIHCFTTIGCFFSQNGCARRFSQFLVNCTKRRLRTGDVCCFSVDFWIYNCLEPQTAIYKWLFQLDDSQSLHRKWLFHQTSIFKWLFGVPGVFEMEDRVPKGYLFRERVHIPTWGKPENHLQVPFLVGDMSLSSQEGIWCGDAVDQ